jgi:hypothetical protein
LLEDSLSVALPLPLLNQIIDIRKRRVISGGYVIDNKMIIAACYLIERSEIAACFQVEVGDTSPEVEILRIEVVQEAGELGDKDVGSGSLLLFLRERDVLMLIVPPLLLSLTAIVFSLSILLMRFVCSLLFLIVFVLVRALLLFPLTSSVNVMIPFFMSSEYHSYS